ncbi:MAG: YncE family protein [Paracoccaceae bacterium]|jgi:DNA-binding beta-propeller fold protein YncE|nr:YncE family protein [Paracoccaceae bacterium]MDP7184580.1 YncE family protein [Paracoccaceae bacterium]
MKFRSAIAVVLATTSLTATIANADAARVFIPEGSADAIRVIDFESGKNVGSIADVEAVHGLAGSPNSPYLVAGSYMEFDRDEVADMAKPDTVSEDEHAVHHAKPKKVLGPSDAGISMLSVIDAESSAVVRKIEVPGAVHHVSMSPNGKYAVSTHPSGDGVSIVDLENFELIAWIPTGPMPNYAAFGASSDVFYVSNAGNGTVSEVDLKRGIVRRNMVSGDTPEHLALDAETNKLYVADSDVGTVIELDLTNGQETGRFEIGGEIHGLDLSDDRASLFVAAKGTDRIVSIDLGSGALTAKTLAPAPYHLTTVPGEDTVYVSSRDEPKVWVVDAQTLTEVDEIQIEGEGHQMVVRK